MALSDFLNTGSTGGPTGFTTSVQNMPDYFQTYAAALMGRANSVAGEPYKAYQGPRVEGFSADQTAAQNQVRANQGSYMPWLNQAQNMTGQAASDFGSTSLTPYMSPYMSGVVNEIARLGTRNLTENLLPQVNSAFTGSGMFGASRHGDFTARAIRDTNESILGQQSNALQGGYNNAMQAYQQDQARKLAAGSQMGDLSQMLQSMGYTDAAQLDTIGKQQQQLGQQNLDIAYQDFLDQKNYPQQQLYMLSDFLRGTGFAFPQTQTKAAQTATPQASPLAILGSTAMGYGALNSPQQQQPYR